MGFPEASLDTAVAIAIAESGGVADGVPYVRADALGDTGITTSTWGPSVGMFQIRSLWNPRSGNAADAWRQLLRLDDPRFNASAAFAISKQATDWAPWSVFRSGRYRDYLGKYGDAEIRRGQT